jgi:hypothetical protein
VSLQAITLTDRGTGEVLKRDVYPAQVLMPDGTLLRACRAFVSDRRVLVLDRNRTLLADVEIEHGFVPASGQTLGYNERVEARTLDGGSIWILRERGCGCGAPVKSMASPWPRTIA